MEIIKKENYNHGFILFHHNIQKIYIYNKDEFVRDHQENNTKEIIIKIANKEMEQNDITCRITCQKIYNGHKINRNDRNRQSFKFFALLNGDGIDFEYPVHVNIIGFKVQHIINNNNNNNSIGGYNAIPNNIKQENIRNIEFVNDNTITFISCYFTVKED